MSEPELRAIERILNREEEALASAIKTTLSDISNFGRVAEKPKSAWDRIDAQIAEVLPRGRAIRLARCAHEVMALRGLLLSGGR